MGKVIIPEGYTELDQMKITVMFQCAICGETSHDMVIFAIENGIPCCLNEECVDFEQEMEIEGLYLKPKDDPEEVV